MTTTSDEPGRTERDTSADARPDELGSLELDATIAALDLPAGATPTTSLGHDRLEEARARDPLAGLPSLQLSREPSSSAEFHVLETLGEGGMGVVELATQKALEREVAIKRLHADRPAVGALLREARITGHLEHPNIVPVHALGTSDGRPAVVMKRIHGTPWEDLIEEGATALERHVEILMQACNALHFAHSKGVFHCDMKPANVMVGEFGEVYVVDWGVAFHRDAPPRDHVRGTPVYMAPELVTGRTADIGPWTDVFLLGASLHHVLTGEPRHAGSSVSAVLAAAVIASPHEYGDDVPEALGALCNRACAGRPDQRYASALELRSALQDYLDERSARELTAAAMGRLDALERAIDSEDGSTDSLFHAARFAFEHVLERRPELPEAVEGHRRCLTAMLAYEVGRGNLEASEALAARLGELAPELARALEALRDERRAERRRFEELTHAADASVAAAQRRRLGLAIVVFMAALLGTLFFLNRSATTAFSATGLFVIAAAIWAFIAGCLVVWRDHLFANAYNRRWAQFLIGSMSAVVLHRGVAVLAGTEPTAIIVVDLTICGCAFLAAAWLSRFFYVVGAALFVLAGVAAWRPESARWLLNFGGLGLSAALLWLWRRGRSAPGTSDAPTPER